MSYDLRIAVKVDGTDIMAEIATPEYYSHPTYNLGQMFRACTGWDYKQGEYYRCSDVIDLINHGITELSVHRDEYKQYEPENGYGTVSSALTALRSLRDCIYDTSDRIPIDHLWVAW